MTLKLRMDSASVFTIRQFDYITETLTKLANLYNWYSIDNMKMMHWVYNPPHLRTYDFVNGADMIWKTINHTSGCNKVYIGTFFEDLDNYIIISIPHCFEIYGLLPDAVPRSIVEFFFTSNTVFKPITGP